MQKGKKLRKTQEINEKSSVFERKIQVILAVKRVKAIIRSILRLVLIKIVWINICSGLL